MLLVFQIKQLILSHLFISIVGKSVILQNRGLSVLLVCNKLALQSCKASTSNNLCALVILYTILTLSFLIKHISIVKVNTNSPFVLLRLISSTKQIKFYFSEVAVNFSKITVE